MNIKDRYNCIAKYYNFFSKLVYGNSLLQIQKNAVQYLPHQGSILLLGGGNGKILPYIFHQRPFLKIVYVEASSEMITLAQKESPKKQKVTYYHTASLDYPDTDIDVVFAPFFFDLFTDKQILLILNKLETRHKPIQWFVIDFYLDRHTSLLNRAKLKASIIFFNFVTNHPLKTLPTIFSIFADNNYKCLIKSDLHGNFIVFKKFIKN